MNDDLRAAAERFAEVTEEIERLRDSERLARDECSRAIAAVNKQIRVIQEQRSEIKLLRQAIADIDRTLRVPAAEYVPAIGDVFGIIDRLLSNYPQTRGES